MPRHLWWILGPVLLVGGLVLTFSTGPQDGGWFAYTPLEDRSTWHMTWGTGGLLLVTRWQLVGCGAAALGLAIIAAGIGYRAGRRRAPH